MEKQAIELIGDNAIAASDVLNKQLEGCVAAIVHPDSFSVSDIERYQAHRRNYRAQLTTESVEDFISYADEQGQSRIFVDAKYKEGREMSARAIFDLGTVDAPLHADHEATLVLEPTAAFRAVRNINGTVIKQSQLADFIEDWLPNIELVDGEDILKPQQAINAIRNVTIAATATSEHREENFRSARSAMEEIEARSNAGRLPGRILFTLEPHTGFTPITVELRVAVRTGEEKPAFVLRWMRQEEQIDAIGQELISKLQGGLDHKQHPVLRGVYKV